MTNRAKTMTDTDTSAEALRPIRDDLGEHGDLYMRLHGWCWSGPKTSKEPEFGYKNFEGEGHQPVPFIPVKGELGLFRWRANLTTTRGDA
jgi:hypothetical protein